MGNNEEKYCGVDIGISRKQNRKISVIMPVYNTGDYLKQSFDSLVNQTFRDFDLICVDDASDDIKTGKILDEYRNKYDFIRVIHLDINVGAGEARNIGFCRATGEYVSFLDADDIFHPCMLEIMYDRIQQENADVCICGYEYLSDKEETEHFDNTIIKTRKYDKKELSEDWLLYNSPNPWTKLCKRNFLEENQICFQSIPACNDVYWSCMVQIKAKKVCFVEGKEILVRYRTSNPNQISVRKSVISIYDAMAAVIQKVEEERLGKDSMRAAVLLFMWLEMAEIRCAADMEQIRQCHQKTRNFLADRVKNISYQSVFYNGLLYSFMQPDFIERRFPWKMTFYEQLSLNEQRLLMLLKQAAKVVLWGNGKRGEAFQKFCKNHNINLWGVADSQNVDIHRRTLYGYEIMSTEEALYQANMMIAGNTEVFEALEKRRTDQFIINLQDFCPLG